MRRATERHSFFADEPFFIMPKRRKSRVKRQLFISAVDLFCGAGGLTRGLTDAGIRVVAGLDIDPACEYPYEHNNSGAKFLPWDIGRVTGVQLFSLYPADHVRVLVGCAPCQPFSKYTQGLDTEADGEWGLLRSFGRLVKMSEPDIVSMENVPEIQRHSVFEEFLETLEDEDYEVSFSVVFCPDYGVPQHRSRLVLFASRFGPIEIVRPTHGPENYSSVRSAIGPLPKIQPGEVHEDDRMHRSSGLSPLNLRRIRASVPGGTWRDWPPSLVAACHRKKKGKSYPGVYGRMEWEAPSPTITTQFFGFGNGRFGHPQQDRGLSLREGAILQSFPPGYEFVEPGQGYCFKTIGRLIGNAVPVRLGKAVGKTIKRHLRKYL
jgi:DNA (cytosine-5)-methyltransferase 1